MKKYNFRWWFYFKLQRVVEKIFFGNGPYILMFHSVSSVNNNQHYKNYTISKEHFIEMIDTLSKNKRFVCTKDFFNNPSKNNILLTFDDVLSDVYENAYPFLKVKNIPYLLFQTYDFLNCASYLSTNQLKEMLATSKVEIGSHSISHKDFFLLNKDEVLFELRDSKFRLENLFNIQIENFAFPYGGFPNFRYGDIKLAHKLGYKYVYTTFFMGYKKFFLIPRLNVNDQNYLFILNKILR